MFLNSSLPSFWSCCYDAASSWHCCSVSFISGQNLFGVPCWKEKKKSWSDTEQNNWPLTSYPFKVCWGQTIQQLLIIHQLPAQWSSVRDREITPDCMLLFFKLGIHCSLFMDFINYWTVCFYQTQAMFYSADVSYLYKLRICWGPFCYW